jgi:ADP-ribosyl-[dinitrogen reductase] hydrolase
MTIHDDRTGRAVGTFLGLACGDALGRPVDGYTSTEIARKYDRVTEMYGGGSHGQPAGTVTADTQLTLCVARSLLDCEGFDGADVAERITAATAADPLALDETTAAASSLLADGAAWDTAGDRVWQERGEDDDCNGALARSVPYGVVSTDDSHAEMDAHDSRAEIVADATRITHADPRAVETSVALAAVVARLLDGADAETAAMDALSLAADRDAPRAIRTALANATDRHAADLGSAERVVQLFETALYDGLTAANPEEGIVSAVSRGGDAPTRGAVAGAVAGARFGADAIPTRWLDEESELRELASDLGTT